MGMLKSYQDISLTNILQDKVPLKISKTVPEEVIFKVKLNWDLNIFIRNRFSNNIKSSRKNLSLQYKCNNLEYENFRLLNSNKYYINHEKESYIFFSYLIFRYFLKIIEQESVIN